MDRFSRPLSERCPSCGTFRYLDCGAGADVCSSCIRKREGKRSPNDQELQRFLNDPDEIYRLEARVKDLEVIVASFAEKAAA